MDIETCSGIDGKTRVTDATRLARFGILTIENLGKDASGGGFSGASRAREEIGMTQAIFGDGVAQR